MITCRVPGCGKPADRPVLALCEAHYGRPRNTSKGDTDPVRWMARRYAAGKLLNPLAVRLLLGAPLFARCTPISEAVSPAPHHRQERAPWSHPSVSFGQTPPVKMGGA